MSLQLKVKYLAKDIPKLAYAKAGDAAFDLFSAQDVVIAPMERAQVSTGVALEIPEGYVGLIWDKSGLSHKYGLKTLGGVIDSGYRGEIMIGMINLGSEDYTFEVCHKVAQMLIQKVESPEIIEVESLDDTSRGVGAFGSTGK